MAAAPLAVAKLRVVGWSYRLKDDPSLQPVAKGALLTLERDRDNEYDKNAVSVVHAGHAIGFLERGVASVASSLLFDGAHASGLRLEATCEGFSAQKHHDLLLRVFAAPGAHLPPAARAELAAFHHQHAPPETRGPPDARLRGEPGSDGSVHMPAGMDPRQWCAANAPSSFANECVAFVYASAPDRASSARSGKWCVAPRATGARARRGCAPVLTQRANPRARRVCLGWLSCRPRSKTRPGRASSRRWWPGN